MIVAIGIDIVEIVRIEENLAQGATRFLNRIYTPYEIAYCEARASKFASFAARFAAKEAAMKALGTGWAEGVAWKDIEVINDEAGKPMINLTGKALERFIALGARHIHVSLSHSKELAIAQVILES
ncbi:MAG: holo-ACP synthase [Acidobacteriota bacterium]